LKRELKRQIREDEFKTGVEHAIEWLRTHTEQLRVGLLVAVIAGGILLGLSTFRSQRTRSSEAAFAAAVETFQAPVEGELSEGSERPATVFPTSEEKFKKAAAGFDGVARQWPSLPAGRRARYYAALCRIELGDLANARPVLADLGLRDEAQPLEPHWPALALADLEQRGEIEKAIDATG
jgi:hypothetical protein